MLVRLGFAVAAHLQCEILVVDEVLAVGDAEFQKKCMSKIQSIAGAGRTVLFVSHNMSAVKSLCERVVRLQGGKIVDDGKPNDVVLRYLSDEAKKISIPLREREDRQGDGSAQLVSVQIQSVTNGAVITSGCQLKFTIQYTSNEELINPQMKIGIYDENGVGVCGLDSDVAGDLPRSLPADGVIECTTDANHITAGRCYVKPRDFSAMAISLTT